jgi:hypothetical protein
MTPQASLRALAAEMHDHVPIGICLDAAERIDAQLEMIDALKDQLRLANEALAQAKDEITWLKHNLNADLDDGK